MSEADLLRRQGIDVDTVGDLLSGTREQSGVQPACPSPRLDGSPEFPEPGIYFGMDESLYHSIHACSASGLKTLGVSSMDYWAASVLNPDREDGDSKAKALGRAYHVRICEGRDAFEARYAVELDKADYGPDLCITVADIRKAIEEAGEKPKGSAKEPLIDQLLDVDPAAKVWDRLVAEHAEENAGKVMIRRIDWIRIELAAHMIEADPELRKAFSGGHPEVSIFWHDERTGCPMKARIDYLKLQALVDLKSFSNSHGRPVSRAIDFTISAHKHYIAIVVYLEGIAAAKKMIRERGASAIHGLDDPSWALKWAQQPEPTCLWVYQQTGAAPVTRGRVMPKGSVYTITQGAVQWLKRRWVECATTYGTAPWLDIAPVQQTTDENIPIGATDFGDQE